MSKEQKFQAWVEYIRAWQKLNEVSDEELLELIEIVLERREKNRQCDEMLNGDNK